MGLGRIEDARVVEPLVGALADPDPEVKRKTAEGLGSKKGCTARGDIPGIIER